MKDASLPTRPTRAEIELAIEWCKKFPQAKLIMSTGDNQGLGITNAIVMADYAVSLGLPRENMIEEDRSLTTYTNLLYSRNIIEERMLRQPTLVTLDLYTRRAVATAKKMGWNDFYWLSVFSDGEPAYGYKWIQTYSRTTIFLYEVGAMLFSKIVGWVWVWTMDDRLWAVERWYSLCASGVQSNVNVLRCSSRLGTRSKLVSFCMITSLAIPCLHPTG